MLGLGEIQKQLYIYGVAKIFWRNEKQRTKILACCESENHCIFGALLIAGNVANHKKNDNMKNIILAFTIIFTTTMNAQYFYMGSTAEEVISVQGEPTGVYNIGSNKIFEYKFSSVTFQNNKVISYSNISNNLKVKYSKPVGSSNKNVVSKKSITKYVYFIYKGTGKTPIPTIYDPYPSKVYDKHSDIFVILDWSPEKELSLETALMSSFKRMGYLEEYVFLSPISFEDRKLIMTLWNAEMGHLERSSMMANTGTGINRL